MSIESATGRFYLRLSCIGCPKFCSVLRKYKKGARHYYFNKGMLYQGMLMCWYKVMFISVNAPVRQSAGGKKRNRLLARIAPHNTPGFKEDVMLHEEQSKASFVDLLHDPYHQLSSNRQPLSPRSSDLRRSTRVRSGTKVYGKPVFWPT